MEETEVKKGSAIGAIFKGFLYTLMYIAIQLIVSIVYGIKIAIDFFNANGLEGLENQEEFAKYVTENLDTNILLIFSIFITFIFLAIIMIAQKKSIKEFFSINKISRKIIPVLILLGIGMNLFFVGILNLLAEVPGLKEMMQDYGEQSVQLFEDNIILNAIVLAVLVPILEEIVFRVLPLNKMTPRISTAVAVILTSLVFGISHGQMIWAIYTFVFGSVLAMIYLKYRSSIANIIVHGVFNFTSFILTILPLQVENSFNALIIVTAIGTAVLAIAIPLYKHVNKTLVVN